METFHYMLMVTQAEFQRKVLELTAKEGLLPGQPKILDFLKDHDGCEQKDIANGCRLDPATVTGLLNRMETAGLVTRNQKDGNRRSYQILMTSKGKKLQKKTDEIFEKCEALALNNITDKERELYMKLMYQIYENLQKGDKTK